MSLRSCGLLASLPQFENLRALRTLAEKERIKAAQSQFPRPYIKQTVKKIRIGSEGWLRSAEFLELAPRGELKVLISLVEGHIPDAILKVERDAVPARGFAHRVRAASDPARPALRPDREEPRLAAYAAA